MQEKILEFLNAYKSLDEICKQTFKSDMGVTKYISEMEKEMPYANRITGWEVIIYDYEY